MNINYRELVRKRHGILLGIIIVIFISLILRLYYLQIYNYEHLYNEAIKQRSEEIFLDSKRGDIFDRKKVPLTNNKVTPIALIERSYLNKEEGLLEKIKDNTLLSKEDLYNLLNSNKNVLEIPLANTSLLKEGNKKIFFTNKIERYSDDNLLAHVLGYTGRSDNTGKAGIEKIYDEYLNKRDRNSFIIQYDKDRSLILEGGHYVNQDIDLYEPSGVRLTIDYEIQKIIEKIIDQNQMRGAVIVSEVGTGEILGILSRPNFNQERIEKYLLSEDPILLNKGTQIRYPPGSIFKIIVLLTALEENPNILNQDYFCKGFEEVNGHSISCSNQHGWISVKEGFAKSCNSLFIQIAEKLGGRDIISMAERLGLGREVGIVLDEVEGILPNKNNLKGIALANTAIGQGNLETTPLQISKLMTIITNDGLSKPMSLVKGITNKDGYIIKDIFLDKERRIIPKESAKYLQGLLGEVVKSGTGKSIDLEEIGGAAGKTGSAQGSLNGKKVIHGWFSGFFPLNNPKYVITILIEDTDLGSGAAVPLFEEIAENLYRLNR